MSTIERNVRLLFVKYGLLLGAVILVLTIFSYYFLTRINTSPIMFVAVPVILRLFIPIFLTAYFCFKGRAAVGGYWSLKQATTCVFIMFLTAFVMQYIGKDILFDKVIAPENIINTQEVALRMKTEVMRQQGAPQKDIDTNMAEMKKDFELQRHISIGSTIQNFIISIIFLFVFSLIFGALFKKDPPAYQPGQ